MHSLKELVLIVTLAGCILQVSSQEEAKVDDGFVAEYNPEYDDGHPDVKSKLAELADAPISPVPSSFWGKIHLPFGYTLANVRDLVFMGTPEAQAHSSLFPTKEKIQDGILSARRFTWRMLERKDVRSFKSVLLMVDVLFVMVSIQSQLDASRERIVGAVLVKDLQPHAPDPQTILHHVPLLRHLPGVQAEAGKFSHMQKAIFFKYEELFTLSASLSILTMLLVEKLARIWARGERWYRRVSEVVDLGVIALSIGFEWIFHTMEHDGSLKSLKGSVLRWVTENWRFVRIVHGSYETLAHSPIVAPMLKGT